MTLDHYNPFDPGLPPSRARALPWLTVMAGSLVAIVPVVAIVPLQPPTGLLMLLAWRLVARFALRLRTGYIAKSGRAVFAVKIADRDVTLPAVNAAFAFLWRLAMEFGGVS